MSREGIEKIEAAIAAYDEFVADTAAKLENQKMTQRDRESLSTLLGAALVARGSISAFVAALNA